MEAVKTCKDKQKSASFEEAKALCRDLYRVLNGVGIYPALTGGLLYKDGERKDIDIVLYRNRQQLQAFEIKDLEIVLKDIGIEITGHYGFVTKCTWRGFVVDLFNPETFEGGEYDDGE